MTAILYRMAQGVPGDVSRQSIATIEAQPLNSALPFAAYGIPGKIVAGLFVPLSAVGDVAPYGFLVRPYPITGANGSDPLGVSVPLASGIANILRRGYMTVQSNAGTPASQGTVYVRYANAAAGTPLGGVEATSVAGSNVALVGVAFMGPADASGNVEVAFNI